MMAPCWARGCSKATVLAQAHSRAKEQGFASASLRLILRSDPKNRISKEGAATWFETRSSSAPHHEAGRALTGPHHFFRLGADTGDAFDLERGAAGFLGDRAVLLDDEAERGRVLLQATQQLGRHAPVGALRAVLIDDVEEHELAFGISSRFLGHGRCPFSIPSSQVPASGRPRNDELNDSHSTTKKKNPAQARGFSSRLVSDRLQICSGRLAVLAIGFDVERKLLALVEIAHAGALDCRDVNEHIRPAAVLHDEAEALLGVEELNGTCGHGGLLLKTLKGVNAPYKPFAWASYPDSACSWGRPIGGRNCKAGEIGTMCI